MVLLDVIEVEAGDGGSLEPVFENQERRICGMKSYVLRQPFVKLREPASFMKVSVALGTVVRPDNIHKAPETLWEESMPI